MRTLVALTLLGFAAAGHDLWEKQGDCMVDGGEAVNDAADAAMFIWAAYKRCDKAKEEIKCVIDISSAIESVNGMVNVMLRAMDKCHHLKAKNSKCGMAAGRLTKNLAGLTAASADIIQKCPNAWGRAHSAAPQFNHVMALCVVDIKDTAKSLFKLVREFMEVKPNCKKEDNRHCVANSFRIIGAFSAIGEYLAGAIGHCSKDPKRNDDTLCGQASSMLLHHTVDFAAAATDLSRECQRKKHHHHPKPQQVNVEIQVPRLFEEEEEEDVSDGKEGRTGTSYTTFILGAFLPITAIVGFVGGRRYASNRLRAQQMRELTSDTEGDIE